MGMSINESIEQIQLLKQLEDSLGNISGNTNTKVSQACTMATDTMRKYQNIKQILDDCLLDDWEILKSIRKVIEDGKID